MTLLYIAIGGGLGSVLRYLMQSLIGKQMSGSFPYGTMLVNISGSIIMGIFIGWLARASSDHAQDLRLFVAVGILGGYTTFSSFSLDAITLMEEGKIASMLIYIAISVICSLLGLLAGLYLVRAVA